MLLVETLFVLSLAHEVIIIVDVCAAVRFLELLAGRGELLDTRKHVRPLHAFSIKDPLEYFVARVDYLVAFT